MKRRGFLAILGAGASASAGCSAAGHSERPSTADETATAQRTFDPDHYAGAVTVGDPPSDDDGVRPHRVRIWNDSASVRTIDVTIRECAEGTTVFDEQYEIPADAALSIVLRKPAKYAISIRLVGTDTEAEIESDRNWFDCNRTTTNVRIAEDGAIDSAFVTTWAECGSTVTGGPDA